MAGFDMTRFQSLLADPNTAERLADLPIDPWAIMKSDMNASIATAPGGMGTGLTMPRGTVPDPGPGVAAIDPGAGSGLGLKGPGGMVAKGGGAPNAAPLAGLGGMGMSMLQGQPKPTYTPPGHLFVGEQRKVQFNPFLRGPSSATIPSVGSALTRR